MIYSTGPSIVSRERLAELVAEFDRSVGFPVVEIGGGPDPIAPVNVDPIHGTPGMECRVEDLVLEPRSVSVFLAIHVFEHLPPEGRVDTMNRLRDALIPGGILVARVPDARDWRAWADPTHVSFWVPETFGYFAADPDLVPFPGYGGIDPWKAVSIHLADGWEIQAVLRRPSGSDAFLPLALQFAGVG